MGRLVSRENKCEAPAKAGNRVWLTRAKDDHPSMLSELGVSLLTLDDLAASATALGEGQW
jgi:hypothetical protein